MPASAGFGDRHFGKNGGEFGGVRNEKVGVAFGNAAGEISGADALLGTIRRKRIYELACDAAAIGLREDMLRLRPGDCETPAGYFQQIERDHLHSSLAQAITTGNAIYERDAGQVSIWSPEPSIEDFRDKVGGSLYRDREVEGISVASANNEERRCMMERKATPCGVAFLLGLMELLNSAHGRPGSCLASEFDMHLIQGVRVSASLPMEMVESRYIELETTAISSPAG